MYQLPYEILPGFPTKIIDLANQLYGYLFDDRPLPDIIPSNLYAVIYALEVTINYNTNYNARRPMPMVYLKPFMDYEKTLFDPEVEVALAITSSIYATRLRSKIKVDRPRPFRNLSRYSSLNDYRRAVRDLVPLELVYLYSGERVIYPYHDMFPYLECNFIPMSVGVTSDPRFAFRVSQQTLLGRLNHYDLPLIREQKAGCILAGGFLFSLSNDRIYNDPVAFRQSDIDLFIYGHPNHRDKVLDKVLDFYRGYPTTYTQTMVQIEVPTLDQLGQFNRTIQIVLSPALSPMDVIRSFDLSHIQLAYDGEQLYTTPISNIAALYGVSVVTIKHIRGSRLRKTLLKKVPIYRKSYLIVDGGEFDSIYRYIEGEVYHRGRLINSYRPPPLKQITREKFLTEHYYVPFLMSLNYGSLNIKPYDPTIDLETDVVYFYQLTRVNIIDRETINVENLLFRVEGLLYRYVSPYWWESRVIPYTKPEPRDVVYLVQTKTTIKLLGALRLEIINI